MSIHNPTNLSPKQLSQFVERKDLAGLTQCLEEQATRLPVSYGPVWLQAIKKEWWPGAVALEKDIEGFKDVVGGWKDKEGNTAWHFLAATKGEWEARVFLTDHPIQMTKNKVGRYPFWSWQTPLWAETWIRLLPPSEWLRIREMRDKEGMHPVSWWLIQKRWALAYWFAQQGAPLATAEEKQLWRALIDESASREWSKSWKMLGK